jgi:hypothetical protein
MAELHKILRYVDQGKLIGDVLIKPANAGRTSTMTKQMDGD